MGKSYSRRPRERLAQAVEDRKKELMSRDRNLSELDAHRQAMALVAKEEPDLMQSYRLDVKS